MDQTAELRASGIGGSDAAAVAGLSKYRTPLDVYREKIGEAEPVEDNDAMLFGRLLEDIIAQEYARRENVQVRRVNKTIRHKDFPFMMAHVDRMVVGSRKGLECKTAGRWFKSDEWGESGTDLVPPGYLLQCQHYMEVIDLPEMDLAALLAGNDWRVYRLKRDKDIGAMLREIESQFWKQVQDRIPPEPKTMDDLAWLYPKDKGLSVIATSDIETACGELAEVKAKLKELEDRETALKFQVMQHIKEGTLLIGTDGKELATCKLEGKDRLDEKAIRQHCPEIAAKYQVRSEYRVLRLKKKKA